MHSAASDLGLHSLYMFHKNTLGVYGSTVIKGQIQFSTLYNTFDNVYMYPQQAHNLKTTFYQSPLILAELFQHNLSYLTACYLYQVMMTLHFLNDVANDAESTQK